MFPIQNPTGIFFTMLCIILLAPLLLQQLRVPHIIGMMLAGVLLGPSCMNVLEHDVSFDLFGKVGLYYIMFLASLEMDMQNMRRHRTLIGVAGVLMFIVPMLVGVAGNVWLLHLDGLAAVLAASMYASHTLVSYPIVTRYGLSRLTASAVAVGGTIVADTLTLLVLATVVGMLGGETGFMPTLILLVKFAAVTTFIFFTFPRLGRWFMRRYNDAVVQYVFVMTLVFAAAVLMEAIGMEGLLGAFLAGLIMNRLIPRQSPLMNHVEFVGNALFIPYFLIGVGMLVNLGSLLHGTTVLWVAIVMCLLAIGSKWIAAWGIARASHFGDHERKLLFGLSTSRAAATLAIVLVGYRMGVLSSDIFNATFVLILVSCLVSSFVTETSARRLAQAGAARQQATPTHAVAENSMLVALAYPETVEPLITLAMLMRGKSLTAVHVAYEEDEKARNEGRELMEKATDIAASAGMAIDCKMRVATNKASGIMHTMIENDFSELLVAQHIQRDEGGSFFGPVLLDLLTGLNRQIMMVRCKRPWNTIRRIHVAVPARAELEAGFVHWVERLARLCDGIGCRMSFHADFNSTREIRDYLAHNHPGLRVDFEETDGGNELKRLADHVHDDHLLVVICARKGSVSYRPSFAHIPQQIRRSYLETSTMLIFPDGYDEQVGFHQGFASPTPMTARYEADLEWLPFKKKRNDN